MRTIFRLILPFLVLQTYAGCGDVGAGPEGSRLELYSYIGYDSSQTVIDQGWLALVFQKDNRLTGQWSFKRMAIRELLGSVSGDMVHINLHPQFVDHNLLLHGIREGRTIRGTWTWVGIGGKMDEGSFEATRDE